MGPTLQISVPTTSTGEEDGKTYTLYHVRLTLPIRTHETRKRYSAFATLHETLIAQTGAAPPSPLPAKSWFRRTVTNAELTESRRRGLEAYVRAILDAQDARWRASPAWRQFLGLPQDDKKNAGAGGAAGGAGGMSRNDDKITDPQVWLDVHREVKSQMHAARQLLKKRDAAASAQDQHAISADAKAALVRAATAIARLEDSLALMGKKTKDNDDDDDGGWGSASRLGDGEIRRRRDMLGAARTEVESLESSLKSLVVKPQGSMLSTSSAAAQASDADKQALWGGSVGAASHKSRRVLGGPATETDRTRELDNQGVLQLQKQVMQEQEQDVLDIGRAVSRMKEMGIMINEELVIQNQMLDLLENDTDRVQGKIDVASKRIKKIR